MQMCTCGLSITHNWDNIEYHFFAFVRLGTYVIKHKKYNTIQKLNKKASFFM